MGERIRQRRIEIGYDDQQVFKDALGTSQSYVSKVERGEGLKLLIALVNLCSVLDCSLDYLALRSDDPRPYFPDVIDDLTIMYQPENPHHRAALLQLMRLVEVMTPDQQMLLLQRAAVLAAENSPGARDSALPIETDLKKRAAFDQFDPVAVAAYGEAKVAELLANPGIVRNRAKIAAAIRNAQAFLAVQQEFGSFDAYIWRFVDSRPRQNAWRSPSELPAETAESRAMSQDLRQRGFTFVGPTICYGLMQAVGMV